MLSTRSLPKIILIILSTCALLFGQIDFDIGQDILIELTYNPTDESKLKCKITGYFLTGLGLVCIASGYYLLASSFNSRSSESTKMDLGLSNMNFDQPIGSIFLFTGIIIEIPGIYFLYKGYKQP